NRYVINPLQRKALKVLDYISNQEVKEDIPSQADGASKEHKLNPEAFNTYLPITQSFTDVETYSLLLMDYIPGKELLDTSSSDYKYHPTDDDKIKPRDLTMSQCISIAAQLSYQLSEIHSRQIIHQDIKAANILIELPEHLHKTKTHHSFLTKLKEIRASIQYPNSSYEDEEKDYPKATLIDFGTSVITNNDDSFDDSINSNENFSDSKISTRIDISSISKNTIPPELIDAFNNTEETTVEITSEHDTFNIYKLFHNVLFSNQQNSSQYNEYIDAFIKLGISERPEDRPSDDDCEEFWSILQYLTEAEEGIAKNASYIDMNWIHARLHELARIPEIEIDEEETKDEENDIDEKTKGFITHLIIFIASAKKKKLSNEALFEKVHQKVLEHKEPYNFDTSNNYEEATKALIQLAEDNFLSPERATTLLNDLANTQKHGDFMSPFDYPNEISDRKNLIKTWKDKKLFDGEVADQFLKHDEEYIETYLNKDGLPDPFAPIIDLVIHAHNKRQRLLGTKNEITEDKIDKEAIGDLMKVLNRLELLDISVVRAMVFNPQLISDMQKNDNAQHAKQFKLLALLHASKETRATFINEMCSDDIDYFRIEMEDLAEEYQQLPTFEYLFHTFNAKIFDRIEEYKSLREWRYLWLKPKKEKQKGADALKRILRHTFFKDQDVQKEEENSLTGRESIDSTMTESSAMSEPNDLEKATSDGERFRERFGKLTDSILGR
ncbi:MAG: hypothetical protein ACE365_03625, partial [Gammaproteobacteria bacterium]